MMKATATNEQRLFPGAMVRGIGLPQVLQDDVHSLQDIASRARILGDPRDGRHDKIHQNLRDVPRHNR
jgi:hypothetical protein